MNFHKFLATGAIVAMTATGAYGASPATYVTAATMSSGFMQQLNKGDHFALDLIGSPVYSADNKNANVVGDISDLVVASDGTVDAVVIGVGGFLGIGEKDVAVPFDSISWKTGADGMLEPVLAATREQLKAAPAFSRDNQTAMNNGGLAVNQKPAPKDQAAGNQPAK
jgi:PRC-barrel domain